MKINACTTIDGDAKPWCSTRVDRRGVHVGGGGHYQHCGDDCPGNVAKGVKYIECLCCFSLFGIPKQFFVLHFFPK